MWCDRCGHLDYEHPKMECSVAGCNCMHLIPITLAGARKQARYWHRMFKRHRNNDDWIKWRKYYAIVMSGDLRTARAKLYGET